MLRAARELFLEQGYGATTVEQIAERAGVSKPTVFAAVGNKQALLVVVRDVAMAGDDEPVAVGARPAAKEIESESDPDRAIDLLSTLILGIASRYAAIGDVVRGAADSGEEGPRELWRTSEEQRLSGARQWVTVLERKAPLAEGLDHESAVDLMWLYMAPDQYHRLVHVRGWSPERYRKWLADRIRGLLRV